MLTRTEPDLHPRPGSLTDEQRPLPRDLVATATPASRTRSTATGSTPSYRDAFDESLADRGPHDGARAQRGILNEEFAEEWERENEEGLRGGWDAARRDKELDADGVVGEVIFPDADAVTSGASAPFGAGLGAERRHADPSC